MKSLLFVILLTIGLSAGESYQCNKALKDFQWKNNDVEKKTNNGTINEIKISLEKALDSIQKVQEVCKSSDNLDNARWLADSYKSLLNEIESTNN